MITGVTSLGVLCYVLKHRPPLQPQTWVDRLLPARVRNLLPVMLKYDVGIDIGIDFAPWDSAVYSEFAKREASYRQHPTHLAIKPVARALRELRGAVDFEA